VSELTRTDRFGTGRAFTPNLNAHTMPAHYRRLVRPASHHKETGRVKRKEGLSNRDVPRIDCTAQCVRFVCTYSNSNTHA
jgi:hypothetical protein